MKPNRVLLQATSIIIALVITVYFSYAKVVCAETQGKIVRIIKKIEIKGNQRISTTAIRSSIRAKEGDPYDPQLVSQDVDAIWSLGFFDNIEVELEEMTDGLKVVFLVTERAVIDEIQFQGNKKIKAKKLKKQIEIKEGDYVKPYLLKLDEDKIKELYIKKCFQRIQVHAESKVADGKTVVVFNIEEGPKIRIAKITFAGNKNFKR
ncbi:MAG: POTRA domain-containing protein, partial [Planctomycetota bacterium]